MSNHTEIARRFFTATGDGNSDALQEICSSEFIGSQNGGPAMGLKQLAAFALAVKQAVPDFRYENIHCQETADGFVEEHDVRGTLPDGTELDTRVCVVAEVEGGKITAMREYVDMVAAAGLIKALQ